MKILALIQARMASTRLPGKVLADLCGQPMLAHVVRRVRAAKTVTDVMVVTSTQSSDDALASFCGERSIPCFRGSEQDVLDRFYQAARLQRPDAVLRITADCPLMDPEVIDRVVAAFVEKKLDYASNILKSTYPDGLDAEVFSYAVLEAAWQKAAKPSEREHVTPWIRNSRELRLGNVESGLDSAFANERWTVDDRQDLEFARAVYATLGEDDFAWQSVWRLLNQRPDIHKTQGNRTMNEGYYKSLFQQAVAGPAPQRRLQQSQAWFNRSKKVVPGSAQTFSKGYTQYVQGVSPVFLQRGKGCLVWDVDGNRYIDYVQGLLPNILGYAHDEVNAAATAQYAEGHSFSLPHPVEVQLAERLVRIIPCAEMVRFAKNGSDATTGAVRAARAYTGRERVACCGYHGWQDWFIGSTARHRGVPGAVRALTHPFPYNDLSALEKILSEHTGEFAAIILEPVNFVEPLPGFLQGVKDLAQKHGAVLIFDEICTGFHLGLGGAQKRYGVTPDLACFGKAMGNGFPIACVVGRSEIMKIYEEIFFSFTFGGEVASMAAAMRVLDILENTDALTRMESNGRRVMDGFNELSKQAGLGSSVQCIGRPTWSLIKFQDAQRKDSLLARSLFQQEVIKRGILILVTHNMTAAHDNASTEETLETYAAVLKTLAQWLSDSKPDQFLEGPMIQPVFRVRG